MSTQATATVETLTAEVRVLMVGSRQITLSVAKQLDVVPLDQLDIFGRIRFSEGRTTDVIGARHGTGELVRSTTMRWRRDGDPLIRLPAEMPSDSLPIVCALRFTGGSYGVSGIEFDGQGIILHRDSALSCGVQHERGEGCEYWSPGGATDLIRQQVDKWRAVNALVDAAEAAPLIVLAGLR